MGILYCTVLYCTVLYLYTRGARMLVAARRWSKVPTRLARKAARKAVMRVGSVTPSPRERSTLSWRS